MTGAAPTEARPLLGVFWMLVTGVLFVAVQTTVKAIGPDIPAAQSAFLRFLIGLVFVAPMLWGLREVRIGRRDIGLFVLRGVVHTLGVVCWFYAMTQITIAEVTAMNFLAPIYVTIGAAMFLGEPIRARRIAAIVVAMLGALVILRPGVREIGPGHLAMAVTGLSLGASYLMAKLLSGRYSAATVVAMMSLVVTILLAPFAWAVWVPPTLEQTGLMFAVAFFATVSHYTMTLAFRAAPLSVTQPVTFLQLIWATALGALVFAEPVDIWVIAGGCIIIAAVSFITWREAMLKRETVAPPHVATKL